MRENAISCSSERDFINLMNSCTKHPLSYNTPLRGQNTWAKMRAKRDSPCVFVPANAVSDYSGLLAHATPNVLFKNVRQHQGKNHATALCAGSLTNTFNQWTYQENPSCNNTSKLKLARPSQTATSQGNLETVTCTAWQKSSTDFGNTARLMRIDAFCPPFPANYKHRGANL